MGRKRDGAFVPSRIIHTDIAFAVLTVTGVSALLTGGWCAISGLGLSEQGERSYSQLSKGRERAPSCAERQRACLHGKPSAVSNAWVPDDTVLAFLQPSLSSADRQNGVVMPIQNESAAEGRSGWMTERSNAAFWAWSGTGAAVMIVAWLLFGFSYNEEMTEQCKALIAGETAVGTGATFGLIPVLIAHLTGLILLASIAIPGRAGWKSGSIYAVSAVAATSAIGIAASELLWGGALFTMGAGAAHCLIGPSHQ